MADPGPPLRERGSASPSARTRVQLDGSGTGAGYSRCCAAADEVDGSGAGANHREPKFAGGAGNHRHGRAARKQHSHVIRPLTQGRAHGPGTIGG